MSDDVAEFIEVGLVVLRFGALVIGPLRGEDRGFDARCIGGVTGRIYGVVHQQHGLVSEDVVASWRSGIQVSVVGLSKA